MAVEDGVHASGVGIAEDALDLRLVERLVVDVGLVAFSRNERPEAERDAELVDAL